MCPIRTNAGMNLSVNDLVRFELKSRKEIKNELGWKKVLWWLRYHHRTPERLKK
jgi:hypothetical protein